MLPYLWLQESYAKFSHDFENVHHAHLLTGNVGIGKVNFAFAYAKLQLCRQPIVHGQSNIQANIACGQCQDCRLFEAGTHPDLHVISSEYYFESGALEHYAVYAERYFDSVARQKRSHPGQFINIDQIRHLALQFANKPHISGRKVAIISPADVMNVNAANALLKLLEEPPLQSLLLLISAQPGLLLPTIRSRCLMQRLPAPDEKSALDWLHQQGIDDDKLAVFEITSPVLLRQQWHNGEISQRTAIRDLIKAVFSGRSSVVDAAAELAKQDFSEVIAELEKFAHVLVKTILEKSTSANVNNFNAQDVFLFYDKVVYYRALQKESINKQLALERLCGALVKT